MSSRCKNKIRTPGYFVKRMRDSGFVVLKIFREYAKHDSRAWTILVNPGGASVYITCYFNRENNKDIEFELNDGGFNIPKNFFIKTDSIEVITEYLVNNGISNKDNWALKSKFIRPGLSNLNGYQSRQPAAGGWQHGSVNEQVGSQEAAGGDTEAHQRGADRKEIEAHEAD